MLDDSGSRIGLIVAVLTVEVVNRTTEPVRSLVGTLEVSLLSLSGMEAVKFPMTDTLGMPDVLSLTGVALWVSSLLGKGVVTLALPDTVGVVVLSLRLEVPVLSLSTVLVLVLPSTRRNDVLGFNVSEAGADTMGTTATVVLTRTVTTTEDGLSLSGSPVSEELETVTVNLSSLPGTGRDVDLSLSESTVADDRDVVLLSLSGITGAIVDLSLSGTGPGVAVTSLSVNEDVLRVLGRPVTIEVRLDRSTSMPSKARQSQLPEGVAPEGRVFLTASDPPMNVRRRREFPAILCISIYGCNSILAGHVEMRAYLWGCSMPMLPKQHRPQRAVPWKHA